MIEAALVNFEKINKIKQFCKAENTTGSIFLFFKHNILYLTHLTTHRNSRFKTILMKLSYGPAGYYF